MLTRFLSGLTIIAVTTAFPVPSGTPLGYRTQINRLNSASAPYTGALVITVNPNGMLTGLYESDSIRPDPLYGRKIPVSGSISRNQIRLQIGNGASAIVLNGSLNGHSISGSASMRSGGIWVFKAERVHLHNPPAQT